MNDDADTRLRQIGPCVGNGLALPTTTRPLLVGIPLLKPAISRTLGLISKKGKRLLPAPAVLYGMLKKMTAVHS